MHNDTGISFVVKVEFYDFAHVYTSMCDMSSNMFILKYFQVGGVFVVITVWTAS